METTASWARASGVELILPDAFPDEPERDPRGDCGRVVRGTPKQVLRPTDVPGLASTLRHLAEHREPYRLRGAAWSSGGQVVSDGGTVVDLTRLDRIVADRPDAGEITVEGGATWLAVGLHLRETGRRPLVQPENLHMTVGGTLALGGFGDTSAVHGLAITQVLRLTIVTPDGQIRSVGPGEPLFHYTLGGAGLTGVIAEATLRTVRRPRTLVGRTFAWVKLEEFGAEALTNGDLRLYEIFQGTVSFREGAPLVHMLAGNFADRPPPHDPGLWELKPSAITGAETVDRFEALRAVKTSWDCYRPSLQLVLPMPAGIAILDKLCEFVLAEPALRASLQRIGLLVFKTDDRFPLAPQPRTPQALALVLRPQLTERAHVDELLGHLRTVAARALELGGKIGLSSIRLDLPDFAERQLGPALVELRSLKAAVDPLGLCNRGVLEGLEAG